MSTTEASSEGTRYRFEQRLASGGMADLFVAQAHAAGGVRKRVAIKRVQPRHAADQDFVSMFLNEARLASTLQHPNIVQTYDVLQVRGEYFIVMELLEGVDLQEFLRLHSKSPEIPLRVGHVLYIVERCLAALHYAHERPAPDGRPLGITHRDVSPHNLFLTYEGGVKLLDFGIAKVQALEKNTGTNMLKGKVLYMAPEQCQAGAIDRRTDLYAVGVLLYRLLGGTFPHRGANAFDTMRAIIHQEPQALDSIAPNLAPELVALVMKALKKDPAERYQTAREMQLEIMQIIRSYGLFVADVEFAGLVEQIAPPDRFRPDAENRDPLPGDLVIGGGTAEAAPTPERVEDTDHAVVSTDVAVVERIHGVTVLRLRGALDERLKAEQLLPHIEGELVIDSEHVQRITSFGIRSLITLFDGRRGDIYHVRVASAYLEQVAMVRSLLGGGRVVSFHLPYVDPETGTTFTELVEGAEAARVLESGKPPSLGCPGAPERMAEFDEDPETYFTFARDFTTTLPEHISRVIELLRTDASKPVEKIVEENVTTLKVLRPLTANMRWGRLLRGTEGGLVLDLERVPWWDERGLVELGDQLTRIASELSSVQLVGVPSEIYAWMKKKESLRGARSVVSLRVSTQCQRCESPRQVLVAAADLEALRGGGSVPDEACPRCGGLLSVTGELPKLTAAPAQPRSSRPEPVSVPPAAPPPVAPTVVVARPPAPTVPRYVWLVLAITLFSLVGSLLLLLLTVGWLV